MPLIDHFDLIAPIYERIIRPKPNERLLSNLQADPDGILLDAGGGTGRISQFLASKAQRILLLDASFGMLRHSTASAQFEAVCAMTEHLPLPDALVSQIIMVDALHHVLDPGKTASELWRVLRPGGRIVIEEPDIRSYAVKLVALFEKLALMRSRFHTPDQIARLFSFPGAHTRIEIENHNAWVVVDKPIEA